MKMSKEVKVALITAASVIIVGLLPFIIRPITPPTPTPSPTVTQQPSLPPTVPPPTLIASPMSIDAKTDCSYSLSTYVYTYTCHEALSISGQGSLNWTASGGPSSTRFNPQHGTLEPGQSITVTISVPVRNLIYVGSPSPGICPTIANLIFTSQTNTVIVQWRC
jgi:hypothetical protein